MTKIQAYLSASVLLEDQEHVRASISRDLADLGIDQRQGATIAAAATALLVSADGRDLQRVTHGFGVFSPDLFAELTWPRPAADGSFSICFEGVLDTDYNYNYFGFGRTIDPNYDRIANQSIFNTSNLDRQHRYFVQGDGRLFGPHCSPFRQYVFPPLVPGARLTLVYQPGQGAETGTVSARFNGGELHVLWSGIPPRLPGFVPIAALGWIAHVRIVDP